MTTVRPNDASGDGFRRALVDLRKTRPSGIEQMRRELPDLTWDHEMMPPHCPAVQEATAVIGDYFLFAVEMRDGFMAHEPNLQMPKISWALMPPNHDGQALTGAAAPTFEEAMARAEVAIRVFVGQAMDG